jgi:hypothetical protein
LKKKKFIILLLSLLSVYILWLGIQIIRSKSYRIAEEKISPLELRGSYHIHTIFSDGRKTVDEIARIASRCSLDFIILTDHGDPNRKSMEASGWKENVLVLAGSELSVNRGHLVALGFEPPAIPFSRDAELADYQIKSQKGFSVIAHPYSKVAWSWGKLSGYDGLEILDFNTMLKDNLFRIAPLIPALALKPGFVVLKMLKRPSKALNKWDKLNLIRPVYGFFSVDAHTFYRSLLPSLQLHVLLKKPLSKNYPEAARQVFTALHKGRFYNAVDSAAQADGFEFWAQKGTKKIYMGEETIFDSPVTLMARSPFPFEQEMHLIHDGKKIAVSSEGKLSLEPKETGFYRVEIYLKARTPLHKDVPWVLSNPIYLREKTL